MSGLPQKIESLWNTTGLDPGTGFVTGGPGSNSLTEQNAANPSTGTVAGPITPVSNPLASAAPAAGGLATALSGGNPLVGAATSLGIGQLGNFLDSKPPSLPPPPTSRPAVQGQPFAPIGGPPPISAPMFSGPSGGSNGNPQLLALLKKLMASGAPALG